MIITANTLSEWMYRGSHYQLTVEIVDDNENPVVLADGDDNVYLNLNRVVGDEDPVLQLEADLTYGSVGLVIFSFEPEDTEDLVARSYHMSVTVVLQDGTIKPVLSSSFGLVAFNAPVIEEEEE